MAYYDPKQKKIILSEEDEECFREASSNLFKNRTPITDSIMEKILPKELIKPTNEKHS